MTEIAENFEDDSEEFNNQADRINHLIKEFMKLKETICKYKKSRDYWETQISNLSTNIWARKIKYVELQKKEANLKSTISDSIRVIGIKEQELKDFTLKRMSCFSEQCNQFRIKASKFTDHFLHAQKEYSNESLSKDVKKLQEAYDKTHNELSALAKKLRNLERLCGLNNLNSREESEEMLKINTVLASVTENNNDKLLMIASAEDMLKKLESEIKQKKVILNVLQNK